MRTIFALAFFIFVLAWLGLARAATVTICSDDGNECYQKKNVQTAGSFENPIQDDYLPEYRGLRTGTYCAAGAWHRGWLRPWEHSPVIKPSCGR